ncbi:hypothetical protein C9415_21550 [Kluyvera sp. Nf5]|nr:hypothetical protein C9415_21550 [Kluyvera sp. Nf5]
MKDETLLPDAFKIISEAWRLMDGQNPETAEWHSAASRYLNSYMGAIQPKNSASNSFTDEDLDGMAHGNNPVANAYRELLEFRRNAANGNSGQVPDSELQKAIFTACLVFLYSCNNGKSYEDTFYDPTTEYYLDISVVAEEIGVVQVMGNRRWLPSKEMQDEIEGVYRKYAMRIMEAAPKVTP